MLNDASRNIEEIVNDWFIEEPVFFITQCMFKIEFSDKIKTVAIAPNKLYMNRDYADKLSKQDLESRMKLEYIRILLKHPFTRFIDSCNKEIALAASEIVIGLIYDKKKRAPFHTMDIDSLLTANEIKKDEFYKAFSPSMSYEEIYRLLASFVKKYGIENIKIPCHVDPSSEVSQWGSDAEATSTITRIVDHIESSNNKGIGSIPGDFMEIIRGTETPYFDYREAVRRFKRSVVNSSRRLTRMRPNRRYGYEQMGATPAYTSNVLIVCDTSGSMSTKELNNCLGFANGFFASGLANCDVIQFDAKVLDSTICTLRRKLYEFKFYGRGGTNISDIIDYVKYRSKKQYDGIVIFTDGEFGFNAEEWNAFGRNVVFCVTEYPAYEDLKNKVSGNNIEVTFIETNHE